MGEKEIEKKAILSWDLADYREVGEEPPECLFSGLTEGESMEEEGVKEWAKETVQCLSVLREECPKKFELQYSYFLLDLEYLRSLGKITEDDYEELKKERVLSFGKQD